MIERFKQLLDNIINSILGNNLATSIGIAHWTPDSEMSLEDLY